MESFATWWLRAGGKSGGQTARRITQGGLLIGRSRHCDLVVAHDEVSRRHSLVHLGSSGPRILVFGHGAVAVSGQAVEVERELAAGDRIEVGGVELEVHRESQGRPRVSAQTAVWVLEDGAGSLFGVSRSPFLIGGSPEDDLRVEGWPEGAAVLSLDEVGGLEVEAGAALEVDGELVERDARRSLRRGSTLGCEGLEIRVVTGGTFASGSTAGVRTGAPLEITMAHLEFLPRGGRLHLTWGGEPRTLYLADRRCDLIAVLLQPPEPLEAGDFVEDPLVIARVWGKRPATRTNLNVLLHRVRKDFERAGVEGRALERSRGGGSTRIVLAAGAAVELT